MKQLKSSHLFKIKYADREIEEGKMQTTGCTVMLIAKKLALAKYSII